MRSQLSKHLPQNAALVTGNSSTFVCKCAPSLLHAGYNELNPAYHLLALLVVGQEQKLSKTKMKLQEAERLQGSYQYILKQLHMDQTIVSKDIADLDEACKHAEKRVAALQKELEERAAENNASMPATSAALQGINQLRYVPTYTDCFWRSLVCKCPVLHVPSMAPMSLVAVLCVAP